MRVHVCVCMCLCLSECVFVQNCSNCLYVDGRTVEINDNAIDTNTNVSTCIYACIYIHLHSILCMRERSPIQYIHTHTHSQMNGNEFVVYVPVCMYGWSAYIHSYTCIVHTVQMRLGILYKKVVSERHGRNGFTHSTTTATHTHSLQIHLRPNRMIEREIAL